MEIFRVFKVKLYREVGLGFMVKIKGFRIKIEPKERVSCG